MSLSFGEYLVLHGLISPQSVVQILKRQQRSRPLLGELAVHRGWLGWGQVLGALSVAEQFGLRFGDALQQENLISEDKLEQLIAEQRAATPTLEDVILELGLLDRRQLLAAREAFNKAVTAAPS